MVQQQSNAKNDFCNTFYVLNYPFESIFQKFCSEIFMIFKVLANTTQSIQSYSVHLLQSSLGELKDGVKMQTILPHFHLTIFSCQKIIPFIMIITKMNSFQLAAPFLDHQTSWTARTTCISQTSKLFKRLIGVQRLKVNRYFLNFHRNKDSIIFCY